MKKLIVFALFIFLLNVYGFTLEPDLKVQKWTTVDLEFKTSITWRFSPTGPFDVSFSAEITGPDNIKFSLPGFYDGDDTWKIRFSPTKEGEWNITTFSEVVELDNRQVKLQCIKNENENVHGGLLVDKDNPRHFIYEDGNRWFPMGYEANWLFAMDMDRSDKTLPTLIPFLDKIAKHGFNFMLLNIYAYDTSWRLGKTSDDDYGPPFLYPWGGSYDNPDYREFNLEYWQHFDRVMEAMYQRGITAYLYFKVYNKLVHWPKNASFEDELFYRWVIARYAAYPNVIWNLAKEAQYEKSYPYKMNSLKFIHSTDPYKRLLTVHDDRLTYDKGLYNELLDFRSSQEHSDPHIIALSQHAGKTWPVLNVESGYEHGPEGLRDVTFGRGNTPEDVVKTIWKIQMTGSYNAYYYTYTAWDIIRPDDTPAGYNYVKLFTDFFAGTQYWLLKPDNALVSIGYCLANPGKEYIIYQDKPIPFELNLSGLSKPLQAMWFQPLTGEYMDGGKLKNGMVELTPPSVFITGPVVLHIRN